ncbi:MAG: transporter [Pirellulales bacterium]
MKTITPRIGVRRRRRWRIPIGMCLLPICGACIPLAASGQTPFFDAPGVTERELETDRDAFTPAISTVGTSVLVVETAYTFIDNRDARDTHSFPELLLRYGISDRIELRFGANYEVGGENAVTGIEDGQPIVESEIERESRVFYGAKAQISEQEGWLPESIFIAQGFTPTSGVSTATQFVGTYAWGWKFVEDIRWDSSIRYGTANEDGTEFHQWAPSTVLRVPFDERWNAHIEYFAIATDGLEDELTQGYISPGMHCLVTPNLELGARMGWGTTDDSANYFVNAGAGLRF